MHTGNSAGDGNDKESGNSQQQDMLSVHMPTRVNQHISSCCTAHNFLGKKGVKKNVKRAAKRPRSECSELGKSALSHKHLSESEVFSDQRVEWQYNLLISCIINTY